MRSHDAYIRLRPGDAHPVVWADPPSREPGTLTFVDIDSPAPRPDQIVHAFQSMPQWLVGTDTLLVRWPWVGGALANTREGDPEELLGRLADSTEALPMTVSRAMGVLRHRMGDLPEIVWHDRDREPSPVLARARAAELGALLRRGNGIWEPTTYHYRLPSGIHDRVFVRLADAIRSPRDARALAMWLTPRLIDSIGIVVDSGTVSPLVLAAHALMQEADLRPGHVASLDEYPRTRLEVSQAARDAARGRGDVLGLLSVSSSGGMEALLSAALQDAAVRAQGWSLEILVDKQGRTSERYPGDLGDPTSRHSVWLGLAPLGEHPTSDADCTACREQERARIVQIDPRSFGAMVLPEPELIVPSVQQGQVNSQLWTLADRQQAVAVEAKPADSAAASRPKEQLLAVCMLLDRLLADEAGAEAVRQRIARLRSPHSPVPQQVRDRLEALERPDAIVITESDHTIFESVLAVLRQELAAGGVPVVPFAPERSHEAREQLEEMAHAGELKVLCVVAGAVTGWTLRQFTEAFGGLGNVDLHGLVVHSRPASPREWQGMKNAFNHRLVALWLSYLPWHAPLAEEADRLAEFLDDEDENLLTVEAAYRPAVAAFLRQRLAFASPPDNTRAWGDREEAYTQWAAGTEVTSWFELAEITGEGPPPAPTTAVLWGQPPHGSGRDEVRGSSLYGHSLKPLALYAAVGDAVHHARSTQQARAAPEWLMFELAHVARSYYDGPLVATILRWVRPHEAWWGATLEESRRALTELVSKFAEHPDDLKVLLPELLLATAQGKVPAGLMSDLQSLVERYTDQWPRNDRVPVEAGLALMRWAHHADPVETTPNVAG